METTSTSLTASELNRYARHLSVPEIGVQGQLKLKAAKVLVIGAGGLGCPVLQYLAAAGVGTIGIVDFDQVTASNLQRQILFRVDDCGQNKAVVAARTLQQLNPEISILPFAQKFTVENAIELVSQFDLVVDGTDNFVTRYLINDACVVAGRPFVSASLTRFHGQVAVFNYEERSGVRGPTYRCLFPTPPAPEDAPSCNEAGVLGILPGIMGTLQANETLKVILGAGEVLSGKVLMLDALTLKINLLKLRRNEGVVATTKILPEKEYQFFCGVERMTSIPQITPKELKAKLDSGASFALIDVREPDEREIAQIGGDLIPMKTVPDNLARIPRDGEVIIYCRSGGRSQRVCEFLAQQGYKNISNLKGGTLAWSDDVDPSLPKY